MAVDTEARIPVYLNDEQAKAALKNLTAEAEKWRKTMYEAMAGGDMKGAKAAEKELKKLTSEATNLKKAAFDVNRVLSNLSSASINDLKKTMSALRREQAGLNRDSKEYVAISQKISSVKSEFDKVNGRVKEQGGLMANLVSGAKQLLPAFSFTAIAAGAVAAFNKITSATDTLGTQWAVFMGGVNGATDEFFRTIASGNWNNFFTNMQEAIRVGREYEKMLDDIEAKQRAMSIAEADVKAEIVKLEEDLRNQGLTNEQRIEAGKQRIKIEEELAAKRTKLAQETFNSETMLVEQQSRMRREQLLQLISDFDSEKKARAERFNEIKKEIQLLEAEQSKSGAATGVLYPGMTTKTGGANPRIAELKQELSGFSDDVAEYAGALALLGNVTDEQLNKMVAAYTGLKDAEVSGRESIKRVIAMVNNLQAEGKPKSPSKPEKPKTTAPDFAAMAEPEKEGELNIGWVTREMETEAQLLAEKKASEQEWTDFLNSQLDQRMASRLEELEIEQEIEAARVEIRRSTVDAVGQLAANLAATAKEGSAAQIAALAVEKSAAIAQIIWNTFVANSKARALFPPTGLPWTAINTAIAAANIGAIVSTTISSIKENKKEDNPGFYDGGFTGYGSDTQVAGVVHKNEYVVNARALRIPSVREKVNMIDQAQKSGTTANVNNIQPSGGGIDNANAAALTKAINDLLKWQPKVYTELIKKDLDTLNDIENKR